MPDAPSSQYAARRAGEHVRTGSRAARAAPTIPAAPWELAREPARRKALLAASLGWMLDSMDIMLYTLLMPAISRDIGMSHTVAGGVLSLTLLAAAAGKNASALSLTG